MKIKKTCKTCEFNFSGTCASHESVYSYGYELSKEDLKLEQLCWEIGMEYYSKLIDKISEKDRQEFLGNVNSKKDLLDYFK